MRISQASLLLKKQATHEWGYLATPTVSSKDVSLTSKLLDEEGDRYRSFKPSTEGLNVS